MTAREIPFRHLIRNNFLRCRFLFQLKMVLLELADTDLASFQLQKLITLNQNICLTMKNDIEKEKLKQLNCIKNPEIQLVLKSSQVEITLLGNLLDFQNTTTLTFEQLINVNDDINNKGNQKVCALQTLAKLKNSMLYNEWKRQFICKKLKHVKEHLTFLRTTKVSK